MIRLTRVLGFLLIGAGAVVLVSYLFEPLRAVWTALLSLPLPIKIGLGVSAIGAVLVLGSMIWERIEARESDRDLLDEP